jgi:hypothetical protein
MNITVTLRDTGSRSGIGIGSTTVDDGAPAVGNVSGTEIKIHADTRYVDNTRLRAAVAAFILAIRA